VYSSQTADICVLVQGSNQCDACEHVQDGPYCEAECPESTYADDAQICHPCNINCISGCTGPYNTIGQGGCNACDVVVFERDTSYCLPRDSDGCPQNFYTLYERDELTGNRYLVRT